MVSMIGWDLVPLRNLCPLPIVPHRVRLLGAPRLDCRELLGSVFTRPYGGHQTFLSADLDRTLVVDFRLTFLLFFLPLCNAYNT